MTNCDFEAPDGLEPAMALQVIINHVALDHLAQIPGARAQGQQQAPIRPPALIRPKIDIGCSPAQWADFLRQWSRFSIGCSIAAEQLTTQAMACFSDELVSTADKAIQDMGLLAVADLMAQVKSVAVQPVAVSILRATAHSAKQASGERFQTFAAKVRGLTTNCNYILPCPHAAPAVPPAPAVRACNVANCVGTDYTSKVIKDILLSGIHDHDVRREVLGTVGVEEKSVHEIIRIVEGKEAARDAASNARPVAAAATSSVQESVQARDGRQTSTAHAPNHVPAEWRAPKKTEV